jgi:hypothetical protein
MQQLARLNAELATSREAMGALHVITIITRLSPGNAQLALKTTAHFQR